VLVDAVGSTPVRADTSDLRARLEPHRNDVHILGPGQSSSAEVLVLDVSASDGSVLEGVSRLVDRSAAPVLAVFDPADGRSDAMGDGDDVHTVLRILRAGASGCIRRPGDGSRLVDAIVTVAAGDPVLDHDLAVRAAVASARLLDLDRSPADLIGLSRREVEVLERLDSGATARQIGAELFVSHETVRSHLKRVYRKLGVHDRSAAVERARLDGILPS